MTGRDGSGREGPDVQLDEFRVRPDCLAGVYRGMKYYQTEFS